MVNRKIIHVDMDCFYAAVEEKYNPNLRGKAVAVGGPPDSRAVICTANYAARKFGVKAAVPSSRAMRLCPHLVLVPPNFERYKSESRKVREIFERFTTRIEPLSLDEAYLDVTDSPLFAGSATLIAGEIRKCIQQELRLSASAGIAPNKFLAKVASDWNKPNGQFVIRPQDIEAFIPPLPIERIFGVGKVTAAKMHDMGFRTCGDLQKQSLLELQRKFGNGRALELFHLSRGEDDRQVVTQWERKSLSVEETFNEDRKTWSAVLKELPMLYDQWLERMNRGDYVSRIHGFVVKMKYADFKGSTHEESIRRKPDLVDFERLLKAAWEKRPEPIRLLGVGVRLGSEKAPEKAVDTDQLQFAIGL